MLSEKSSVLTSKMCSLGMDYGKVTGNDSVHKLDEVFLLPHDHVVNNTLADSSAKCADEDSLFDELDQLVHIDTDMSSLLQVMDLQLIQCCHRSDASHRSSGNSLADTEHLSQNSETLSDSRHRHTDIYCHDPVSQSFHEYDPVYVPHNDAAAMARRVDNETSYVRTLQSQRNCSSPYEEVRGIRQLFLHDHPTAQVHQPVAPPRSSSITLSHLPNSDSNRLVAEHVNIYEADETDSQQTTTDSDLCVADESIVINPVGSKVQV